LSELTRKLPANAQPSNFHRLIFSQLGLYHQSLRQAGYARLYIRFQSNKQFYRVISRLDGLNRPSVTSKTHHQCFKDKYI